MHVLRTQKNVLTQACFVACTFFYARYFPRSSFTSCNVIATSSRSMAVCTRISLSSNTLWIFFPTGHCGFGFSWKWNSVSFSILLQIICQFFTTLHGKLCHYLAARYGNRQIFPNPTDAPAADSTKPIFPEKELLFVVWFFIIFSPDFYFETYSEYHRE